MVLDFTIHFSKNFLSRNRTLCAQLFSLFFISLFKQTWLDLQASPSFTIFAFSICYYIHFLQVGFEQPIVNPTFFLILFQLSCSNSLVFLTDQIFQISFAWHRSISILHYFGLTQHLNFRKNSIFTLLSFSILGQKSNPDVKPDIFLAETSGKLFYIPSKALR